MAPPVEKDQEILIPLYENRGDAMDAVTVNWSQSLSTKSKKYYPFIVDNLTTDNPNHIFRIGEKSSDGYKVRVDNHFQYGEKNKQGDLRFLVYHDKDRKPYQHRFIQTALGSTALGKVDLIGKALGQSEITGKVTELTHNFTGVNLFNF